MNAPAPFRYRVFGLTLGSEIELPELDLAPEGAPADAFAVRAPLPAAGRALVAGPAGAICEVPEVARYRISGGRRIEVDAFPATDARDVRLYLLGSALGALLHQRGLLPLHANALVRDGRAFAFTGHSGAGKSTLAAHFHDRGYDLLTDDVCVVDPHGEAPLAFKGIPRLRLWRDAVERSGRSAEDYDPAFAGLDKFTVPAREAVGRDSAPLERVYLLVADPDSNSPVAQRRLQGAEAVEALVANTYRGAWVSTIGDPRRHLETCVALARKAAILELRRPWSRERLGDVQEQIEALVAAPLPGAG